jgi:predicted anti-sigma-YlaC factor YlaD
MHRIRASAALVLTAFFAVAGSFHHHPVPTRTHEHTGFCSAASAGIAIESCALCKALQNPVHLTARSTSAVAQDAVPHLIPSAAQAECAGRSLLSNPRAPPRV